MNKGVYSLCLVASLVLEAASLSNLHEGSRGPRQNVDIGGGGAGGGGGSGSNAPNSVNVVRGVGCGTVPMKPNQIIEIQSSNFGVGNYFNKDACTWTFTAEECQLSVYCPCFSIPGSLGCLEDYVKIAHLHFQDKFCGDNPPVGVYRASGSFLTVRFRSDYKATGRGFLCRVRCTGVGMADPVTEPITCPSNTRNPYAGLK